MIRTSGASSAVVLWVSRLTSKLPSTASPSHSTRRSGGTSTVTEPITARSSISEAPAPSCARVRSSSTFPASAIALKLRGSVQPPSRATFAKKATVPRRSGTRSSETTTGWIAAGSWLGEVTVGMT